MLVPPELTELIAADTIPTHRASRALVVVIERSLTAAPVTAAVPARSGPAGCYTLARQLVALPTRDGAALRIRFVLDKQINAVATRQRKLNYP